MPDIRTFIAIRLTPEVTQALARVQARLRQGPGGGAGRWLPPEGVHLTVKFLGKVPSARLAAIEEAVQRACAGRRPFVIVVSGVGCFPQARNPRIVWAGVREAQGQLLALQQALERELAALGLAREERAFTPHLTLARVGEQGARAEREALGAAVAAMREEELGRMVVREVRVIKSELKPHGAVYSDLCVVRLNGEEAPAAL
jgi:2'-5' RNA ligase